MVPRRRPPAASALLSGPLVPERLGEHCSGLGGRAVQDAHEFETSATTTARVRSTSPSISGSGRRPAVSRPTRPSGRTNAGACRANSDAASARSQSMRELSPRSNAASAAVAAGSSAMERAAASCGRPASAQNAENESNRLEVSTPAKSKKTAANALVDAPVGGGIVRILPERDGSPSSSVPGGRGLGDGEVLEQEPEVDALAAEVASASLTPLRFLRRSADVWAARPAVQAGPRAWTYAELHDRVRRMAGALRDELGIGDGDRVAMLLPNVAPMLELHYAVPGAGGVLVPLNTRLTADDYAYVLEHSGARAVVAYRPLEEELGAALERMAAAPRVVWVEAGDDGGGDDSEYADLLAGARPADLLVPDERALLSINYTSGTTGRPKGVMYRHRGAYLHSLGVIAEAGLGPRSAYLWTLPMFHCHGWAYMWAVTATGGRHVCLAQVDPAAVWPLLLGEGVTHFCAAPTVITMLLESPAAAPCPQPVRVFVGGAPPSPALLGDASALNLDITHLYGLTETYGPIGVCAWNPDWDAETHEVQARLRARQGVSTVVSEPLRVVDEHMRDVPRDGVTMGEVAMRGDNVMAGYYRDPEGTRRAFAGGWFHSGDLGVVHPDGYVELRDRLKDVVISGGENIATIEVEQALVAHPAVSEAAVVGAPDERWGEVPVAFVTAAAGGVPDPEELCRFAGERLARFKIPRRIVVVDDLPKTGTGKIQKFVLRDRAVSGR
ncbi:MAG TPA: AMP-binding protein [Solirubrobacteraceae bacterium]|nr:AMP-binding protein [Solirubrobacteraceae bacterium]